MRVIFILIMVMAFSNTYAEMCNRKNTTYYRSAKLRQFPAEPSEPISSVEADQLKKEGGEYFIHVVCGCGEPVSLTKR